MLKLISEKIFHFYAQKCCLSKPVDHAVSLNILQVYGGWYVIDVGCSALVAFQLSSSTSIYRMISCRGLTFFTVTSM